MTTAVFLGDSFTGGNGEVDIAHTFPNITAARLGWNATLIVEKGFTTVWVDTGKVFADELPGIIAAAPDVVVIEGGTNDNDVGFDAAVRAFFGALRAGLPLAVIYGAAIHLLDTYSAFGAVTPVRKAAFTAAVQSVGGILIDFKPWFTGTGKTTAPAGDGNRDVYVRDDGLHPSIAGAAYLGTRLAFAIRPPATGLDY